ncbi:MAG: antibiotic biosynthesis monooxygenase [Thermodesulfobacteriota bacterium]
MDHAFIQGMIISFLKLKPIPEKRQAVLDILGYVKEHLQMKRGCLESTIYEECDPDPLILFLEAWQSKMEMDRYIESDVYLRVLNAMDLCRERPDISFHEISSTKGMDWIAALRLKKVRGHCLS